MGIYEKIAKNETCVKVYRNLQKNRKEHEKRKRIKGKYTFIDRKKDSEKLCIILAGYKEYLYEDVFARLEKFTPKDIDVCIVSSGLYSEKLNEIAKKNNWSYLSVKKNKVSLAQNIAINIHQKAKYIYKLDEDIFITENFFTQLFKTYEEVEKNGRYRVGFVAPLIPISGYAHVRVLEKTGLIKTYEDKFGKAEHNWDTQGKVVKNPEIAKFMWGKTEEKLRDIDSLSKEFAKQDFNYSVCSIRFSIGAILFKRDLWEDMGRFVVGIGNNMGQDEIQLCNYILSDSRAIIVSENTVVGHFSFGPQTNEMKKFYQENREIFKIK